MKICGIITVFGASVVNPMPSGNITDSESVSQYAQNASLSGIKTQRRYQDFRRMFLDFYSREDLTRIYGYGCYCLNLGDRPLTGNLSGVVPVDETDALCHKWTKCNRCAQHDHDEFCTPETVKYKFDVIGKGGDREVQCTDRKNSCARSLCECDKWSVENLKNVIQTTNPKYLAHRGFVAEEECQNIRKDQRTDRGKIECCGEYPNRTPYNTSNKQCCNNKLTFLGDQC